MTSETVLPALVVILALNLFTSIGKFLFEIFKKKSDLSEKNISELTAALHENSKAVEELKSVVMEFPKFKKDLRRLFAVAKRMAGDEWNGILKEIVEEENLKGN